MNRYRPTGWNSRAAVPRPEPGTHRDRPTGLLCVLMIIPVSATDAVAISVGTFLTTDRVSTAIPSPGPPRRKP